MRRDGLTARRPGSVIGAETKPAGGETLRPETVGVEPGEEPAADAEPAVAVDGSVDPAAAGEAVPWPDESAEAAFLGEARERGETVAPKKTEETAEETAAHAVPPLETLVERIPAEVRDVLEDLFRAKFTGVKRVPKKALKRQME